MSIVTALAADLHRSHKAALRRYGELLATAEGDKAVKELKQLMTTLDKSEPAVAADARVVQETHTLRKKIAAATPDLPQRQQAATQALAAFDAETAALLRERRAGYFERYATMTSLDRLASDACQAKSRLEFLLDRNPDLLSFVKAG